MMSLIYDDRGKTRQLIYSALVCQSINRAENNLMIKLVAFGLYRAVIKLSNMVELCPRLGKELISVGQNECVSLSFRDKMGEHHRLAGSCRQDAQKTFLTLVKVLADCVQTLYLVVPQRDFVFN